MKRFAVTFKENKKYNPTIRTVEVETENAYSAEQLIHSKFGSFKYDRQSMQDVPSDKISILKTKEVKERK